MSATASPNLTRATSHLEPVPDLPVPMVRLHRGPGSLQLQMHDTCPGRACIHGPFLSLYSPQPDRNGPLPPQADGLHLQWQPANPCSLQLVPPGQQRPVAPDCWLLQVPLEPLLLKASAGDCLPNLVIDHLDALPAADSQQPLVNLASSLIASAANADCDQGRSTQWLQLEEQLITQLVQCLQRPDLAGAQRRDRGWRHVSLSLAWMAAHLGDAFSLADVAAEAGITPRALQMAYRKHLGKRPLQSLRLLRLAELRRLLLQSASPTRRLIEHLERCGLTRSGSTARHYRERYGEKPSQTRG
jgi:AraC-like DNA-binding protein